MGSRRKALEGLNPQRPHPGLWLDKYLESLDREDTGAKRALVGKVAGIGEPEGYGAFFARWREALQAVGAEVREAETLGRLAVGLGGEGVLETALALHRTYGVPYIPGSALKGLASRYAHLHLEGEAWRRELARFQRGEAQAGLFGTQEERGAVVFFDALPLPGTWRLWPDILNPHHPAYYRGEEAPPADWDSPIPVPFLSVTGTFLLALRPAEEGAGPWVEAAWQILEWALSEEGVGAKTASGYGRMRLLEPPKPPGNPVLEGLLQRVRSGGVKYRDFRAFLKGLPLDKLRPEDWAELRQALEEKGFLRNKQDLRAMAKEEGVRRALEALGVL
ncbi:type III-B CRISPR module RAMP protein Cmr6 [Thermus sp.]|uniref:type III-B CRISPR module RAMP protein Cmr6 n=1 Tax=Thermus sp. TaxID=275 RepID=UPI00307F45E1